MKDMINDLDFKAKIAEIENKMDQKWSGGEQRISGVEKKISGVDQKINGIEEFMIEILNIIKNNKWFKKHDNINYYYIEKESLSIIWILDFFIIILFHYYTFDYYSFSLIILLSRQFFRFQLL